MKCINQSTHTSNEKKIIDECYFYFIFKRSRPRKHTQKKLLNHGQHEYTDKTKITHSKTFLWIVFFLNRINQFMQSMKKRSNINYLERSNVIRPE